MIYEEMTWREIEEGLRKTKTIIIPVGSIEAHGEHLPVNTDYVQAYEIAKRAAREKGVFVAPPIIFGYCRSTGEHPGTISILPSTLRDLIRDVIRSLYRQGFRKFIVFSSHAGSIHLSAIEEVCEMLLHELRDARIAVVSDFHVIQSEIRDLIEEERNGHAGEIETSRMLYLRPELVRGLGHREFPIETKPILVRNKRKYWPSAIAGDPTRASREKGKKLVEIAVRKLCEIIDAIEEFED